MIPTPSEEEERVHNTLSARESQLILKMASLVIENAGKFLEVTFLATAGHHGRQLFHTDQKRAFEWAVNAGYESIQDGLTTVIKFRGKILRTMTANVEQRYAEAVAKQVMQLIRKTPAE